MMGDGEEAADLTRELRVTYIVSEVFSHENHEALPLMKDQP